MSDNHSRSKIANMAAIQTAIANQDHHELAELLGSQALEPMQKDYLLELAELGHSAEVKLIIEQAPEK